MYAKTMIILARLLNQCFSFLPYRMPFVLWAGVTEAFKFFKSITIFKSILCFISLYVQDNLHSIVYSLFWQRYILVLTFYFACILVSNHCKNIWREHLKTLISIQAAGTEDATLSPFGELRLIRVSLSQRWHQSCVTSQQSDTTAVWHHISVTSEVCYTTAVWHQRCVTPQQCDITEVWHHSRVTISRQQS